MVDTHRFAIWYPPGMPTEVKKSAPVPIIPGQPQALNKNIKNLVKNSKSNDGLGATKPNSIPKSRPPIQSVSSYTRPSVAPQPIHLSTHLDEDDSESISTSEDDSDSISTSEEEVMTRKSSSSSPPKPENDGGMQRPGNSRLTFDHLPSRPLQKSRETGAEPHSLDDWMNEIDDPPDGIKELGAQPQNSLYKTPVLTLESLTVDPVPDSSVLVEPEAPACSLLISLAFSMDEVTALIEAIFTNKAEVRMVRSLSGDAAQVFVDVVHKVCLRIPSFPKYSMVTFVLLGPLNLHLQPVRPWVSPVSRRGFRGIV